MMYSNVQFQMGIRNIRRRRSRSLDYANLVILPRVAPHVRTCTAIVVLIIHSCVWCVHFLNASVHVFVFFCRFVCLLCTVFCLFVCLLAYLFLFYLYLVNA